MVLGKTIVDSYVREELYALLSQHFSLVQLLNCAPSPQAQLYRPLYEGKGSIDQSWRSL